VCSFFALFELICNDVSVALTACYHVPYACLVTLGCSLAMSVHCDLRSVGGDVKHHAFVHCVRVGRRSCSSVSLETSSATSTWFAVSLSHMTQRCSSQFIQRYEFLPPEEGTQHRVEYTEIHQKVRYQLEIRLKHRSLTAFMFSLSTTSKRAWRSSSSLAAAPLKSSTSSACVALLVDATVNASC
jgi:hypothetical protein